MSGLVKIGLTVIVAIIAIKLILGIAKAVLALVVPLAVVAGIALLLYALISSKCSTGRSSIFR